MNAPAAILEVENLRVSFGGLKAVNDVSFSVQRGSVTSVIGPNGAGKSTLFNLICGAIAPDHGRVRLKGNDVTGWPPNRIARAGLARSFQITNLFFDLPVEENLRLAAQALEPSGKLLRPKRHSQRANAKVRELLERFELSHKAGELAGYLSHGEQRRLEIAVALAGEPELLLLDEPTQGMSHGDTADTSRMIRELARDITVLLIEHDIELVMGLSHWVVVMHQGQKLSEGPPEQVRADPAVRKAYLGEA
jgi:branched-chain amino acid transport system ATP-binding protein